MPIIKRKISQLGEQLKSIAKANKMNMQQFAKSVNISDQRMSEICRGANPQYKLLKTIAQKYDKQLIVIFADRIADKNV